jgi:hypothetical protein
MRYFNVRTNIFPAKIHSQLINFPARQRGTLPAVHG